LEKQVDKIQQKLVNLLSMAARAGKIASGEMAVSKAVERNEAVLILVAESSAEKTREIYNKIAGKHAVPLIFTTVDKELLGNSVGKSERAAIAICDSGFAAAINKILR
jgi:ribosomal protein L7Ae-like RNA K-turn-binding protein